MSKLSPKDTKADSDLSKGLRFQMLTSLLPEESKQQGAATAKLLPSHLQNALLNLLIERRSHDTEMLYQLLQGNIAEPGIEKIIRISSDPENLHRETLIPLLKNSANIKARTFLLEALDDPSVLVATEALSALSRDDKIQQLDKLIELTGNDNPILRMAALESITSALNEVAQAPLPTYSNLSDSLLAKFLKQNNYSYALHAGIAFGRLLRAKVVSLSRDQLEEVINPLVNIADYPKAKDKTQLISCAFAIGLVNGTEDPKLYHKLESFLNKQATQSDSELPTELMVSAISSLPSPQSIKDRSSPELLRREKIIANFAFDADPYIRSTVYQKLSFPCTQEGAQAILNGALELEQFSYIDITTAIRNALRPGGPLSVEYILSLLPTAQNEGQFGLRPSVLLAHCLQGFEDKNITARGHILAKQSRKDLQMIGIELLHGKKDSTSLEILNQALMDTEEIISSAAIAALGVDLPEKAQVYFISEAYKGSLSGLLVGTLENTLKVYASESTISNCLNYASTSNNALFACIIAKKGCARSDIKKVLEAGVNSNQASYAARCLELLAEYNYEGIESLLLETANQLAREETPGALRIGLLNALAYYQGIKIENSEYSLNKARYDLIARNRVD